MQRALLAAFVTGRLLAADANEDLKTEREKLQGVWVIAELTEGGKKAPDERRERLRVEFTGDKIQVIAKGSRDMEGTYRIDPKQSPATIDITLVRGDKEFKIPSLYELKGDVLRLCQPFGEGGPRPEELEATKKTVLLVLNRQKS